MSINLKEHEEEDDDLIILPEMDNLVQPADPGWTNMLTKTNITEIDMGNELLEG